MSGSVKVATVPAKALPSIALIATGLAAMGRSGTVMLTFSSNAGPGDEPLIRKCTVHESVWPFCGLPELTAIVSVKVAADPLVTVTLTGVRLTVRFGSQELVVQVTVAGTLSMALMMASIIGLGSVNPVVSGTTVPPVAVVIAVP